jgi:hypothetical protein
LYCQVHDLFAHRCLCFGFISKHVFFGSGIAAGHPDLCSLHYYWELWFFVLFVGNFWELWFFCVFCGLQFYVIFWHVQRVRAWWTNLRARHCGGNTMYRKCKETVFGGEDHKKSQSVHIHSRSTSATATV